MTSNWTGFTQHDKHTQRTSAELFKCPGGRLFLCVNPSNSFLIWLRKKSEPYNVSLNLGEAYGKKRNGIEAYLSIGTVAMVTLLLVTCGATHRVAIYTVMIRVKLQMRNIPSVRHIWRRRQDINYRCSGTYRRDRASCFMYEARGERGDEQIMYRTDVAMLYALLGCEEEKNRTWFVKTVLLHDRCSSDGKWKTFGFRKERDAENMTSSSVIIKFAKPKIKNFKECW